MDTVSIQRRHEIMSLVRGKDTRPEMIVRRLTHQMGYRYRLHRRNLPGVPDLVFPARRKVIFVHGCFWHRHRGCANTRTPKSNISFWERKLADNCRRDLVNFRRLAALGWRRCVIW
ncbi:MAG: very short patch repair endonuclease, partial [Candidatus Binataceae bacterium]